MFYRLLFIFANIVFAAFAVSAQNISESDSVTTHSATFRIHFPLGKSEIRQDFANNRAVLADMKAFLQEIDADSVRFIKSIALSASASPEGPRKLNEELVRARAQALEQVIETYGHDCPHPALSIADADTPLDEYPDMRYAEAAFLTIRIIQREPAPAASEPAETPTDTVICEIEEAGVEPVTEESPWTRRMYVKSNLPAWALLISNAAFEIDVARHWSVTIPVYWTSLNYFTRTVKFRTLTLQPEVRYWFGTDGGWFVGGHFGMGWFNFALGGSTRYQDHDGRSPALGGGLSFGYRMNLGRSDRWRLEFSLGAGVYHVNFDRFENRPDGPKFTSSTKRTWAGVDNAAVTLSYSFDY